MKIPSPKYIKAVTVLNSTGSALQVKVVWKDQQGPTTTQQIEASQSYEFPERDENMGTWTAVVPVFAIEVIEPSNLSVLTHHELAANSVEGRVNYSITTAAGVLLVDRS